MRYWRDSTDPAKKFATAKQVFDDLYFNYKDQTTSSRKMSKLARIRRKPGQDLETYVEFLSDGGDEVIYRDNTNDAGIFTKISVWIHILEECPSILRAELEEQYDADHTKAAVTHIRKWTANHPHDSPFSVQNLQREKAIGKTMLNWPQYENKYGITGTSSYQRAITNHAHNAKSGGENQVVKFRPQRSFRANAIEEEEEHRAEEPEYSYEGATLTEITESDNEVHNCWTCHKPGHQEKNCPEHKTMKQTVPHSGGSSNQRAKSADKSTHRHQPKSSNFSTNKNYTNKSDKPLYYCRVCKKKGHTFTFCRWYKRCKAIMASMNPEKKAGLHAAYLQADLDDADLHQVHKEMTDMVTQSDPDINAEDFVSEVFSIDRFWDEEGMDPQFAQE